MENNRSPAWQKYVLNIFQILQDDKIYQDQQKIANIKKK